MNVRMIIIIVNPITISNFNKLNSIRIWTGIQQANALGTIVKKIIFIPLPNITSGYKDEFNNASLTASVK